MLHHRFSILAMIACILFPAQANARQWNATPQAIAQEYVIIQDQRSPNDLIMLFWVSPRIVPDGPDSLRAKEILDEYKIIGAVHVNIDLQGRFTYLEETAPKLTTLSGALIAHIKKGDLPPVTAGTVTTFQKVFSGALGGVLNHLSQITVAASCSMDR